MMKPLLSSKGIVVGFAREDLHQTSSGYFSFSKGGGAGSRKRGFTLLYEVPVDKVIWLWRKFLIWVMIWIVSPLSTSGLNGVD